MLATWAFAPTAAAQRDPRAPDALAAAVDRYHRATIAGDTGALGALVTDDYMLVNSDGSVQGKASYLADFLAPGFRIEPYRIEGTFTKVQSSAALAGGSFRLHWTQDGRGHSRHLRAAHFWVRQDSRWRLAYTQLTRIAD